MGIGENVGENVGENSGSEGYISSGYTPPTVTTYFSWDCETDTTSIGDVSYNGNTALSTDTSHTGSKSMKLIVMGNDGGNNSMGAEPGHNEYGFNPINSTALYYRWWMRINSGFSWGSGTAKTKSSRSGTVSDGLTYTGYLQDYGFLIGECGDCLESDGDVPYDDPPGAIWIDYDFTDKDDSEWHEYIVKVKPNTSGSCTGGVNCDAEFAAWVDGNLIGEYNNYRLTTQTSEYKDLWAGWMVNSYWQLNGTVNDGGTIYIDDISTANGWNSTTYFQGS